jgi:hypothetical protein
MEKRYWNADLGWDFWEAIDRGYDPNAIYDISMQMTCQVCGSVVIFANAELHESWHDELDSRNYKLLGDLGL